MRTSFHKEIKAFSLSPSGVYVVAIKYEETSIWFDFRSTSWKIFFASAVAKVVALDECDPATFNAAVGADFCKKQCREVVSGLRSHQERKLVQQICRSPLEERITRAQGAETERPAINCPVRLRLQQ